MAQVEGITADKIAYVDEMGVENCLYRTHGWSPRGKQLPGMVSGRRFKRTGIVAAQLGKTIIEPLQYDGSMDSVLFEAWFEMRLLPSLPKNTVIVMDNASFHRKGKLSLLAVKAGLSLIFLPPYSPELNPIEHFWAWLKRHLQKILPLHTSFDDALCASFQVR